MSFLFIYWSIWFFKNVFFLRFRWTGVGYSDDIAILLESVYPPLQHISNQNIYTCSVHVKLFEGNRIRGQIIFMLRLKKQCLHPFLVFDFRSFDGVITVARAIHDNKGWGKIVCFFMMKIWLRYSLCLRNYISVSIIFVFKNKILLVFVQMCFMTLA